MPPATGAPGAEEPPGVAAPRRYITSTAPPTLAAVLDDLSRAYARLVLLMSLTSDELVADGADPEHHLYDRGDILDATTSRLLAGYNDLRNAIDGARELRTAIQLSPAPDSCDLAAVSNYLGMAYLFAGEFFGEWAGPHPGITITGADVRSQLGSRAEEELTMALALDVAGGCTDSTTPIGQSHADGRLSLALRARARASLGDWSGATADAASVPSTAWTFGFGYPTPSALQASITSGEADFGGAYSVSDGTSIGVIDTVSATVRPRAAALRSALGAGGNPDLVVVSGAELVLIRARARAEAGDVAGASGLINSLRADDGLPAGPTFGAVAAARDYLLHERQEHLFLQGRRLRDQYEGSVPAPEWDPGSDAATQPGSFLPIPAAVAVCSPSCPDRIDVTGRTNATDGIVLVDGRRPGALLDECISRELAVETAGSATLVYNALTASGCRASVSVFERGDRLVYVPAPGWTDLAGDVVTAASGAPYVVPLVIWRQSASLIADAVIQADLDDAEETFGRNRVGAAFSRQIRSEPALPETLSCDERDALGAAGAFAPGLLNVYYVQTIELSDGTHPLGLFCADPTPGADVTTDTTFVLVDRDSKWATTLTHELGHAFLRSPQVLFHPRDVSSTVLPESNLMSSYALGSSESNFAIRDSLSLGQAFRMNVHEASWLNRALEVDASFSATTTRVRSEPTVYCPCDWIDPGPCPPLGLHYDGGVVLNPGLPSVYHDDCFDRLLVDMGSVSVVSSDAAALLDGLSTNDGGCTDDVLARSNAIVDAFSRHWHNLEFEDLLDPAPHPCHAEIMLFSRHHRLHVGDYVAADFTNTGRPGGLAAGTQDQFDVTSRLSPPVPFPMTVWPDQAVGTCATFATTAIDVTTRELFAENRTGLDISISCDDGLLTGTTGAACAPAGMTPGQVNVRWVAAVPAGVPDAEASGGVCPGGEVVYLVEGAATPRTALAHQLGHVFALEHLASPEPGFTDLARTRNLMSPGLVADEALRDRFTLGQVVRMYHHGASYLRSLLTLTDRCSGGASDECPELWIDAPR
jgi:hypothetical protein